MDNNLICKICGRDFSSLKGLTYHITHTHKITAENYYLNYIIDSSNLNVGKCVICNKPTVFISIIDGYQKTCSKSCGGKLGAEQGKQTTLLRYGKKSLNNMAKNNQYYLVHPEVKQQAINKMIETKKINGTYENLSVKGTQKKLDYITEFEQNNNCTMVYTLVRKYGQGWYKAHILSKDDYIYSTYKSWNLHFVKNSAVIKILNYNNETEFNQSSHGEKSVVDFIKSIYLGEVIENSRSIISPLELDIYIPEKHLAIEYNGTYYHSIQAGTDKLYHFNKSKACEDLGIRLIHIYEFQWQNSEKQAILKSIIKNALGINDIIIYARKCQLRELTMQDVKEFSNINSLHAHRAASIYLGLFFNNELVEVMTFGKAFFSRDSSIDYECIRSITKLNTTVVGGMNKLFTYFIHKYNPNKILYYVDYNTHIGNSMSKLGFNFIKYSKGGIINISNDQNVTAKYGYTFNRKPAKNAEIKKLTSEGRVLTIYDAGVKKYIWTKQ